MPEIAIVGAGIGGLAAALALTRSGHRVVVYERYEQSKPLGSGLLLQPTGLAALQRLGLRSSIEALGARIERLHGINKSGAPIFDLAYADLDPNLFAIGIHRAALHGALLASVQSRGASLETSCMIGDLAIGADGRAGLIDADGRRSPLFDLVIDASGARSPLRRFVTPTGDRSFRYGAVWANIPDIGIAPTALSQRYVSAHTMMGYLPIGRASANSAPLAALFWSLKAADYPAWQADFAARRELAAQLWPELAAALANLSVEDFTLAAYRQFTAPKPFRGRLALIGDAAHATSPQLGQGANSALLDALALTDALDGAPDIAQALESYARRRRAHVRFYQLASLAMTPFFQSDSALLGWLRDRTFHPMRRVGPLHRQMLLTLAGLKTGLFASASAELLARSQARSPQPG